MMSQLNPNQLVFESCALCGSADDLQASHIVPKFAFEWMKDTSVTGHIRFSQTSNRHIQDGFKPVVLFVGDESLDGLVKRRALPKLAPAR